MTVAITHKSFTYRTGIDDVAGRSATLHGDHKPPLRITSPPEFKGKTGLWTPEDFFVGAVESCLMLTFVGIAEKAGLRFASYASTAAGLLEWDETSYRFTRVIVRPRLVLEDESSVATARELMARAHQTCLIANSLRCAVEVEPTFGQAA